MSARVSSHAHLLSRVKAALGTTSKGIGEVMGVSRRTVTRHWVPSLVLNPASLRKLATAVLTRDRGLAEELAAAAGTTLEAWGLIAKVAPVETARSPVLPAPEPPLPALPPAPPLRVPPNPRLVDSVVCAAAELLAMPPQAVRPALYAAFQRAQELDLDLEMVMTALGPTGVKKQPPKVLAPARSSKPAPATRPSRS